jgi:CarD family transcriptional regulator
MKATGGTAASAHRGAPHAAARKPSRPAAGAKAPAKKLPAGKVEAPRKVAAKPAATATARKQDKQPAEAHAAVEATAPGKPTAPAKAGIPAAPAKSARPAVQAAAKPVAPKADAAKPAPAKAAATSATRKAAGGQAAPAPETARETAPGTAATAEAAPAPKPAVVAAKTPVVAAPPAAPAAARAEPEPADTGATAPAEPRAPDLAAPAVASAPARPAAPMGRPMPPPRQPSKAETFVEGDHVVYPTHGVGKVERIAVEDIAGHRLELIHITFEENRMTLRVPVTKARTAGLRKLATREQFDEAMTLLRGRARIKRTMWSRRAQEYEAKINSGDPLAIAEVVRDLHRNAGQPDQSFSERQIYESAMDRLAAELAALDQTDKMTAVNKLIDFLKTV